MPGSVGDSRNNHQNKFLIVLFIYKYGKKEILFLYNYVSTLTPTSPTTTAAPSVEREVREAKVLNRLIRISLSPPGAKVDMMGVSPAWPSVGLDLEKTPSEPCGWEERGQGQWDMQVKLLGQFQNEIYRRNLPHFILLDTSISVSESFVQDFHIHNGYCSSRHFLFLLHIDEAVRHDSFSSSLLE